MIKVSLDIIVLDLLLGEGTEAARVDDSKLRFCFTASFAIYYNSPSHHCRISDKA